MSRHDEAVEAAREEHSFSSLDGHGSEESMRRAIKAYLSTYRLPCDVTLPPATTIKKGCSVSVLFNALRLREDEPDSTYGGGDELDEHGESLDTRLRDGDDLHSRIEAADRITTLKAKVAELEEYVADRRNPPSLTSLIKDQRDTITHLKCEWRIAFIGKGKQQARAEVVEAKVAQLEAKADGALQDAAQWSQEYAEQKANTEALEAENAKLREALEWYGGQARLCRLIHSEGDAGRNSLAADGGKRTRAALSEHED